MRRPIRTANAKFVFTAKFYNIFDRPILFKESCDHLVACHFYTYDYGSHLCYHYEDCPSLTDEYCPRCVSGQPGCGVGEYAVGRRTPIVLAYIISSLKIADQFLMVIGGSFAYDNVEIISLDDSVPVPECLINTEPLPDGGRLGHAAGIVLPGTILCLKKAGFLDDFCITRRESLLLRWLQPPRLAPERFIHLRF